jgi:deoxyribonuclease-4
MSLAAPWLGSHLSISGGIENAVHAAIEAGCDCVQIFTKNQRQWKAPPLLEEHVQAFAAALTAAGWGGERVIAHNSYLVNMASPVEENWEKSVCLMREELERCERLAIPACVAHPGAHLEATRKPSEANVLDGDPSKDELKGLKRIVKALDRLEKETRGYTVRTALENTVGSGTNLGYDFTHLGWIRANVKVPERVGFCFDTCHAVAAGYDMSTRSKAKEVLDQLDQACCLEEVCGVHLNDSIGAIGSRKDRHTHIGQGTCSLDCFSEVLSRTKLRGIPMALETEKGLSPDGQPWDTVNLQTLRSLIQGGVKSRGTRQPA